MRLSGITTMLKSIIPSPIRRSLGRTWLTLQRPWRRGSGVRWGSLRRLRPLSAVGGFDRGQPIDRYYIEGFLQQHRADVRGRVLEVADPGYTHRFGGDRVTRADVLHAAPGNSMATLVGDLARPETLPEAVFDCVILTQTLMYIFDVRAALATVHRGLKPGGVLLATAPGISPIWRPERDQWGEYWRFTTGSMRRLCEEVFGGEVRVAACGNVLAAVAFLHGMAADEVRPQELAYADPDFEVLVTVRAVKGGDA
jgi:SAM-dependent methyltransferase